MTAGLDTDEGSARDYKWKPIPVSRDFARFAERSRARWDIFEYAKVCLMQSLEDSPRGVFQEMGKRMRLRKSEPNVQLAAKGPSGAGKGILGSWLKGQRNI